MNTKRFFLLLFVIVLLVTACASAITNEAPLANPAQPPSDESVIMPVTGENAVKPVEVEASESRMWSGEIFLSGNDAPDQEMNLRNNTQRDCTSEDSLPRRQSGCIE